MMAHFAQAGVTSDQVLPEFIGITARKGQMKFGASGDGFELSEKEDAHGQDEKNRR